jgi:predicted metal-dependent phosphotriesterase family hydrolase
MSFVRTILGDIAADTLGVCYAHEHVWIDDCFSTRQFPEFLLNDRDKIVAELQAFHAAGGRAVVDAMPIDAGRNLEQLAEVSRRSGVHVIAPTGLHLAKYYPTFHWSTDPDPIDAADRFVADITQNRCGVIKVAGSYDQLTERESMIFTAAAAAHVQTGCPILTHTEDGTAALEQIECLRDDGVDLAHVCLSHTDRKPDLAYHREILASGVRLEFDSAFRAKQGTPTLDLLTALIGDYPDQLMLGMDMARSAYWRSYGGAPGLTYLLTDFTQQMRQRGITDDQLHRLFVTTPASTFSFARSKQ